MVHGHSPNRSLHKYGLKQENVFEYNWIMRKLERHNGKFSSKAIFFFFCCYGCCDCHYAEVYVSTGLSQHTLS